MAAWAPLVLWAEARLALRSQERLVHDKRRLFWEVTQGWLLPFFVDKHNAFSRQAAFAPPLFPTPTQGVPNAA